MLFRLTSSQNLLRLGHCCMSAIVTRSKRSEYKTRLTIHSSLVWLDMDLLHLSILNFYNVPLTSNSTKDGSGIKTKLQSLGEFALGIAQEAELKESQHRHTLMDRRGPTPELCSGSIDSPQALVLRVRLVTVMNLGKGVLLTRKDH